MENLFNPENPRLNELVGQTHRDFLNAALNSKLLKGSEAALADHILAPFSARQTYNLCKIADIDAFKRGLFADYLDALQKYRTTGYTTLNGSGASVNVAASELGEQCLWLAHLRYGKGLLNAGTTYVTQTDPETGIEFEMPIAVEDVRTITDDTELDASPHLRTCHFALALAKAVGIPPVPFIKSSTAFGADIREHIRAEYEAKTFKKFETFLENLDAVFVHHAPVSEFETYRRKYRGWGLLEITPIYHALLTDIQSIKKSKVIPFPTQKVQGL